MPSNTRVISSSAGVTRFHTAEDGKQYRHWSQDGDDIIKHVKQRSELNNSGIGKKKMHYIGSYSLVDLMEFCKIHGCTPDILARNEGGMKDKFTQWLLRERPKFVNPEMRAKYLKR